jgi:hypothetical protein
MSAAGLRVAIVGSAMYAADHALERRFAELEAGAIVILGGEPGFQERVQELATAGGIETVTPGAGPVGRPRSSSSSTIAKQAVHGCDLLLAFWDGSSHDVTQIAAGAARISGKPFRMFGPDGSAAGDGIPPP